ncbi:MAG: metallophosphoesterase [Methylococcaceae bacterium]|nr:metallophosphoesterase [Methylococcaceae bacterium]
MDLSKKILFAGDPHGNFRPLISAVKRFKPKAVVLLGDYDLDKPLEDLLHEIIGLTEIWWIAGNHDFETPDKHRFLFHSSLANNHLHLKVFDIAGIRIAGLSGIFLGRVWYPPKTPKWTAKNHFINSQHPHTRHNELPLKYQSAIWHDEFHEMAKLKADILVTHEAPGSHKYGFSVIGELALAMGVKHIFHGHLHENYKKIIKQNIQVVGVANSAIADLVGNTITTLNDTE